MQFVQCIIDEEVWNSIVNDRLHQLSSAKRPPGSTTSHGAAASVSAPGTIKALVQEYYSYGYKVCVGSTTRMPDRASNTKPAVFFPLVGGTKEKKPPSGNESDLRAGQCPAAKKKKASVYRSITVAGGTDTQHMPRASYVQQVKQATSRS